MRGADLRCPAPFGRLGRARDGGKKSSCRREFTIRNGSLTFQRIARSRGLDRHAETLITHAAEEEEVRVTAVATGPLIALPEARPAVRIRRGHRARDRGAWSRPWPPGRFGLADRRRLDRGRAHRGILPGRALPQSGLPAAACATWAGTRCGHPAGSFSIARETDPGARFTFWYTSRRSLKLIYSMGLNDPGGALLSRRSTTRFRVGREVTAKVQYEDTGYTYGIGQRWRWGGDRSRTGGGARRRATDEAVTLTEVRLEGVPAELEAAARGRSARAARIGRHVLASPGRVRARARPAPTRALPGSARVRRSRRHGRCHRGQARSALRLDGGRAALAARPHERDIQRSFFEEEAIENGARAAARSAHASGHVKAQVVTEVRGDQAARTIVFKVTLGDPAVVRQ